MISIPDLENTMAKILVVDDEELFCFLAQNMLGSDYDVQCVTSGNEALKAIEDARPDLVLADMMMPVMSGSELRSEIHNRYGDLLPVVLMSADDGERTQDDKLFVSKPLKKDELQKVIENILTSNT